jgi:hypothetical protein
MQTPCNSILRPSFLVRRLQASGSGHALAKIGVNKRLSNNRVIACQGQICIEREGTLVFATAYEPGLHSAQYNKIKKLAPDKPGDN